MNFVNLIVHCLVVSLCITPLLCEAENIVCDIPSIDELQILEDAGDIRASYLLGARHMNPNGGDHSWEKARLHFAKAAARLHPPSMYFYALLNGGDSFEVIRDTAERGFKRAYADLAYIYSNKEGDRFSRVDAYAWIMICTEHDWLCRRDDLKKFIESLSDTDKAQGEQLKARIIEKQKIYPALKEISYCINEWDPPPR